MSMFTGNDVIMMGSDSEGRQGPVYFGFPLGGIEHVASFLDAHKTNRLDWFDYVAHEEGRFVGVAETTFVGTDSKIWVCIPAETVMSAETYVKSLFTGVDKVTFQMSVPWKTEPAIA